MNEEEKKAVERFKRLYLKDFNNEKITNEDRLSYMECALITNLIEKLQKENEELKENNKIVSDLYCDECIPKQIIKDKIEELKAQYKIALEENNIKAFILKCQITILQELVQKED